LQGEIQEKVQVCDATEALYLF